MKPGTRRESEKRDMVVRIREAIVRHPPMPALYRDLMVCLRDPEIDFARLAWIVRFDPGVTMNILKVVNSAAFSGTHRIDSLQQAVVRLGARRLFQIIVTQGVATQLAGRLDGYGLEPRMLLNHSIAVALTAENLAVCLSLPPREMLFTAGLLHDMGKVVLDPFLQEVRPEVDAGLQATREPFDVLERDLLGVTHAEAGSWLMARWEFPEELIAIVGTHHHPDVAAPHGEAALLVHLADTLVYSQGVGDGIDGFRYHVAGADAAALGLHARDVERVASRTLDQLHEWEALV